jgi:dephospho-CoA kinase
LIGIAGKAGSGKTTAAEYLRTNYCFDHKNFADPLKETAAVLTGLPLGIFYDEELKEKHIDWLYMSPRELLQKLGTDCVRNHIAKDFWVTRMKQELDPAIPTVIGDVRFFEEARMIQKMGGIVIEVERDTGRESTHASENIDFRCDVTIDNNDTLVHLYNMLDFILEGRIGVK